MAGASGRRALAALAGRLLQAGQGASTTGRCLPSGPHRQAAPPWPAPRGAVSSLLVASVAGPATELRVVLQRGLHGRAVPLHQPTAPPARPDGCRLRHQHPHKATFEHWDDRSRRSWENHSHCGDYTSGFNQLVYWCCVRACNVQDVLRR